MNDYTCWRISGLWKLLTLSQEGSPVKEFKKIKNIKYEHAQQLILKF